jgi:hypothetical protein
VVAGVEHAHAAGRTGAAHGRADGEQLRLGLVVGLGLVGLVGLVVGLLVER